MSNTDKSGCIGIAMIIVHILAFIGLGFLAWDWVEPDDFGSALLFLLAWAFLDFIAHKIIIFIFIAIDELIN